MIVGLVGQARHGKTTAAEYLAKNYDFSIVSCSAPLKEMLVRGLVRNPPPGSAEHAPLRDEEINCQFTPEQFWSRRIYNDRTEFTRWLLQFVGTEVVRAIDPDHFAWKAVDAARHKPRAVLPDVRFQNEAEAIRAEGGIIVRVVRLQPSGVPFSGIEYGASHASEQEQRNIDVDYTVVASTLEELHVGVEDLMRQL